MANQKVKQGRFTRSGSWIDSIVNAADRLARRGDWKVECNYPPPQPARGMLYRNLHVWGNPPRITILAILVMAFCVFGPMGGFRGPVAFAIVAVAGVFMILACRWSQSQQGWFIRFRESRLVLLQVGIIFVLCAIVWYLGGTHREAEDHIYRHVFIPFFVLLMFTVAASALIAAWLFRGNQGELAPHLPHVELFFAPAQNHVPMSVGALARSLATTPIYYPLRILGPAAFCGVLFADRDLMKFTMLLVLILAWLAVAAAGVHKRFSAFITIYREMFLVGGQLVVSIGVIALAIARLCGEPYVTTLIESGPGWGNERIVLYIVAAYVFLWFHEYWLNRILSNRIIGLFRSKSDKTDVGRIRYPVIDKVVDTKVLARGRYLQAHSGGRFAVVGRIDSAEYQGPAWHFYRRDELIDAVMDRGVLLGYLSKAKALKAIQLAEILKQKIRFYFTVLNVLVVAAALVVVGYFFQLPAKAAISAQQPSPEVAQAQLVNLNARLFEPAPAGARKERAILLAASGGGTRAALYAESVLRGLGEVGALRDVVLVSAVSGGSAAAAYFAAHRDKLLGAAPDAPEWTTFSEKMAEPFIQDVLEGASEWRIIAGEIRLDRPTREGVRLGELLAESFERRFFNHAGPTLGSQRDVAFIFNTTLTGEFPRWPGKHLPDELPSQWRGCQPGGPLALQETRCQELRSSLTAGGRLIFTNLQSDSGFPQGLLPDAPDEYLTYHVVRDPNVPLARAAAATANFPPVFSNIAIDIDERERYWVTDGGASDNRGIESLLYALTGALKEEKALLDKNKKARRARPHLHIVVAEASAINSKFVQDRGTSARFGAPAKFASQLMLQLIAEARWRYKGLGGKLTVHYLPMPLVLRADGGIGTHWMLQRSLSFDQPLLLRITGKEEQAVTIKGEHVRNVIDSLHSLQVKVTSAADRDRLWPWICNDPETKHQMLWQCLATAIGGASQVYEQRCDKLTSTWNSEIRCPEIGAGISGTVLPTR